MKTIRERFARRLWLVLTALFFAAGFDSSDLAMGAPTTGTIRFKGTDFEGRQNFQLDWNAEVAGNYLVQSADDLSSSNGWQTIDSVTSSNAGPVRWSVPEVLSAQRFYRLVLPQPEIFSVAPGVVDTTVADQYLYILGQCLPTNADVVIDGIHFTPEIINSNGVWARISLNGLPSGQPVLDFAVIDLNDTNTVADFPHPFYAVDSSSPYLLEPPTLPPASPTARGAKDLIGGTWIRPKTHLKASRVGAFGIPERDGGRDAANVNRARTVGDGDCDDKDPCVMPFSGEVQQRVVDLAIAGRGLDFLWSRTYRSRTTDTSSAFGPHWTCSYDIRLQPLGGDIAIHDGTGRADTYYLQTNGTYTCPGFFREGTLSNNVFRLTFADGGIWEFNPFDGTATAGLLAHVMNGNGDIISLYYDGSGRLAQVVDDLGRTNTVSYNSDGQLAGLTDFDGRTVTYSYYQMGEAGGSPGDLKSVTSPPVTGTPNGNDFPSGKTITYTYTSGYTNDLENHLLLSVIDAAGQTVRQFAYQHTPGAVDFLRCLSVQCWTNTPAVLSYLPQTPTPANQFAVMRCVLNDPVGDVMECFYDARNRCVTERDFTGRAVPGMAVTDVDNRPAGKLRSSDPDYYETRWTWDNDSLCTSVVWPGGNSQVMVYERTFNQNSSRSNYRHSVIHDGDLRVIHEYTAGGQAVDMDGDGVADTAERVWRFEYDPRFGTGEGAARENGGSDWSVGDWAVFNGKVWQKVDNSEAPAGADAMVADTTGPFDPTKWQSLARTTGKGRYDWIDASRNGNDPRRSAASGKNIGLYVQEVSGQNARSGRNVGINEPLPHTTLSASRKGWDGTIKDGDCIDSDPARVICPTEDSGGSKPPRCFPTSIQNPRGNVTTASYDDKGNCVHVERLPSATLQVTRPEADAQADFTYDTHGQLVAITNAPDVNGYRRVDTFDYYTGGSQAGYLQSIAIDEPGMHLTTSFEHDARGNVTRCVDPRGNDWLYTYNSLDQCVRCASPTNITSRCATDYFYDANNNLVQTSAELRDATDKLQGSKVDVAEFDPLHHPIRIALAVDDTHAMTNNFVYDNNSRCVEVLGGDAVSGADPHQTMSYEYDERGLLLHEIAAAGSSLAATNEFDYDANGNVAQISKIESFTVKQTTISRDGFDRLASITDPMGNGTVCFYDANDNLKTIRLFGETNDVSGSAGNLRLAETRYDYDGFDRCVRIHELHFNPATQAVIGDGERTTSFGYAPNGECISRTNDLGHVTTFGHDTAGRLSLVTSPDSRTSFAVLLNGNGLATSYTETDLSDLGGAPQVFSRSYAYDSLDRCISTADNVGNTTTYSYDSLDRCVETVDPRGVHSFYSYDLLGRCTQAIGDLDGDGVPDLADDIVQTATWSSSSSDRLLATTDSHSNTTSYAYDTLGNCTTIICADGTHSSLIWSPRRNLLREEDANGSVITNTYDLNERLIHRDISARTAVGVADTTTFETFEYDGCSRLTGHHDDDCDGYLNYDSLGNCQGETLNGLATTSTYDALGNRLSLTSPGPGGSTLNYTYDSLERCSSISESGKELATYAYDGPDRVSRIDYGNGMVTRIFYDGISGVPNAVDDYGWSQVSRVAHALNGATAVSDCTFEYDANQNKGLRSVLIPGISQRTNVMAFRYDRADRLTESLVADDSVLTRDTVYHFDRMGNRTNVTGAACSGDYALDGTAPGPLDYQMNQYTATPCDARTYDDNGNLLERDTAVGPVTCQYDYANRLVLVQALDSGLGTLAPVASYRYDALGRRISKAVYSGGVTNVTQFFYDHNAVIEERLDGAVFATYLVDDRQLLGLRVSGKDYYLHGDDQGNTVALTDANGGVVERYEYDDYGAVTFLAADGTPLVDGGGLPVTASPVGNVYCWGGFRLDSETGLQNDDGSGYVETTSGRYVLRAGVPMRFDQSTGFAGNNPWSPPASKVADFGLSRLHSTGLVHRDIAARNVLYEKFKDGDIPTQDDGIIPGGILQDYFETGDKPTQAQFSSLIDSVANLIDDRYLLGLRTSGCGLCGTTDHLIFEQKLGEGAFGTVYRSSWQGFTPGSNQQMATKRH